MESFIVYVDLILFVILLVLMNVRVNRLRRDLDHLGRHPWLVHHYKERK